MDEPERDTSFGSGRPLSLGVQEELFLVDPVTGVQVNTGRAALARAPENAGTLKRAEPFFARPAAREPTTRCRESGVAARRGSPARQTR
jgi:hypothetical protein